MNNDFETSTVAPETDGEREIDLREFFSVLLSKALWILLCMAIFAAGAAAYTTAFVKPQYTSSAVIYVNDGDMSSTGNVAIATYLAEDYAKMVGLRSVLEQTLTELGIKNMTYRQIASRLNVSLDQDSRVVTITYTDTVAERAQQICSKICEVSKARFEEATYVERVSIFEEATLPDVSSGSGMTRNVLLGAIIGFVLPCAIILLVYMIDDRIKSSDDIQRALNISTLGNIPFGRERE